MKIVRPISPLRRRMLEDMQIRNYSPHTIDGYLRYAGEFAKYFQTSPEHLGAEHIRTYQLHLLHKQVKVVQVPIERKQVAQGIRYTERARLYP